ncbi:hypothetical protein Hdeb2414_s0008g00292451 [Helianthus debilis subsp. tardiflorus]
MYIFPYKTPSPSLINGLLPIHVLNSSQPMESNSIPFISFINSIHDLFSTFSCFCSHPLFSTFVTIYTLILLYAPSFFLKVVLSPVLNSTAIILLFLLKFGANERSGKDLTSQEIRILGLNKDEHFEQSSNDGNNSALDSSYVLESPFLEQKVVDFRNNQINITFEAKERLGFGSNQTSTESMPDSRLYLESDQVYVEFEHDLVHQPNPQYDCDKGELLDTYSMKSSQVVEKGETRMEMDSIKVDATMKFLEWNMKAPLEIIYEAYEGEEEDDDSNKYNMDSSEKYVMGCERYPSLSLYYPESETDSSSDDDFPVNEKWKAPESVFFKWETEDDERDELIEISLDHYGKRSTEFCQDEEDSLIEIDIFPQETE